jgi:glycerol kinase
MDYALTKVIPYNQEALALLNSKSYIIRAVLEGVCFEMRGITNTAAGAAFL